MEKNRSPTRVHVRDLPTNDHHVYDKSRKNRTPIRALSVYMYIIVYMSQCLSVCRHIYIYTSLYITQIFLLSLDMYIYIYKFVSYVKGYEILGTPAPRGVLRCALHLGERKKISTFQIYGIFMPIYGIQIYYDIYIYMRFIWYTINMIYHI